MASLYDLLVSPDPETEARALQDLLRKRGARGAILAGTGDRALAPMGAGMVRDATAGEAGMPEVMGQRFRQALAARELSQREAQNAAQQQHQAASLDLDRQRLGLERSRVDQDAWSFGQDPTGGGVLYNKKTGQIVKLSPQGALPGAAAGLKPAQFEADVQSLGKDVEPIAKAKPDVEALRAATAKDDVAGFGPLEGRLPNVVTSKEGVANRQAAGRLMAAIIQATSGQAASEKEVDRLLEANGMGRTATTEQLRQGIEKLDAQYQTLLGQREAKYHPDVVKTYGARGGLTSKGPKPADDASAALRAKYGL